MRMSECSVVLNLWSMNVGLDGCLWICVCFLGCLFGGFQAWAFRDARGVWLMHYVQAEDYLMYLCRPDWILPWWFVWV